jgi:hypothetical protein
MLVRPGALRPGIQAKANINSRAWLNTPILAQPASKKALPVVVNPIFEKCVALTNDETWKSIFKNASIGKFPKGFGYNAGSLFYHYRKKVNSIIVPENPIEAFEKCRAFFKDQGGISTTQEDQESENTNNEETSDSVQMPKIWSKVDPKMKHLYLRSYVTSFIRKNKLTVGEGIIAKQLLNLCFYRSLLTDHIVSINDFGITEIKGFWFDASNRETISIIKENS